MANSYPRRDQARGIWKINQITKNIKDQGTYPVMYVHPLMELEVHGQEVMLLVIQTL
jgi:hypothetical protein